MDGHADGMAGGLMLLGVDNPKARQVLRSLPRVSVDFQTEAAMVGRGALRVQI